MTSEPNAPTAPPVDIVLSETIASLAFAAHSYLSPSEANPSEASDLEAAGMALDVAGVAFERIEPRLGPEDRAAFARLLTDLRLTFVKKRGL